MFPSRRLILLPCLILASSCSDGGTDDSGQPPTWSDAPTAPVSVGEGRTVVLPLTLSDPDGGAVTATVGTPPVGIDATVVEGELLLHAIYGAQNAQVTVELADDNDGSSRVTIDLEIARLAWVEHQEWSTAEGPEEREHATVIYDSEGQQAFLFGGSGYHPQFTQIMDDFWRYDIASGSWSAITPTGDVPPGAGSRRYAGAWGSGEGYLFGGYEAASENNELYRVSVDGETLAFELIDQASPPSARSLHGFAYDPESDRYFMFGGVSNFIYGDTWSLTVAGGEATWTQLDLPVAPSPRYGFFYGFDEEAGRFILYAGAQGTAVLNPATDAWALDVRVEPPAWVLVTDPTNTPQGRRNGCSVWDPTGPRLVVFGGTPDGMTTAPGLHILDARPGHESWASLELPNAPPARSSGFGFADGNRVYLGFGNDNAVYRDWGILGY